MATQSVYTHTHEINVSELHCDASRFILFYSSSFLILLSLWTYLLLYSFLFLFTFSSFQLCLPPFCSLNIKVIVLHQGLCTCCSLYLFPSLKYLHDSLLTSLRALLKTHLLSETSLAILPKMLYNSPPLTLLYNICYSSLLIIVFFLFGTIYSNLLFCCVHCLSFTLECKIQEGRKFYSF